MVAELVSTPAKRRGVIALVTACLLAAGLLYATESRGLSWWSAGGSRDARQATALTIRLADDTPSALPQAPAETLRGSPEERLIAIYRLVGHGRLDEALAAGAALTHDVPNFRLAQLLHADLLTARMAPLAGWGGASEAANALSPLRDEAHQRLAALRERPPQGQVPAEFIELPASVPFAVAVDTSRSRLYLFENSPQGPHLAADYYVSLGKQGVDKLSEGDQKTPLGLYWVTDHIEAGALQDRFGTGALPLNYPNAYDKTRGRTGKGILLHGVPAASYSRPPLDSDGCVVLANDDLHELSARLPQRDTPVLITRRIEWRSPAAAHAAMRPDFLHALDQWRASRLAGPQAPSAITDTSIIAWKDDRDVMVVTFREQAGAGQRQDHLMRQYWAREGADWRIVADGQVH